MLALLFVLQITSKTLLFIHNIRSIPVTFFIRPRTSRPMTDTEQQNEGLYLGNNEARALSWSDVAVTVKDNKTGEPNDLLLNVNGHVKAGEQDLRCISVHAHLLRAG